MELAEHETMVIMNDADKAEGFFKVYTTKERVAKAYLAYFPGAVVYRTSKKGDQITSWDIKVPAEWLKRNDLGFKSPAAVASGTRSAAARDRVCFEPKSITSSEPSNGQED